MTKVIMGLKTIDNPEHLVHKKNITKFLNFLSKSEENVKELESCYLVAENLKEARLFVVFCFGGLQVLNMLSPVIDQSVKESLYKQLSKFEWSPRVDFSIMFQKNAKLFGDLYPRIKKQVIDKLNGDQTSLLFDFVKQSYLLNGVKIRNLGFGKYEQYRKDRRQNQSEQLDRVNGTRYLVIAAADKKMCYVGALYVYRQGAISESYNHNSGSYRQSSSDGFNADANDKQTSQKIAKENYQKIQQNSSSFHISANQSLLGKNKSKPFRQKYLCCCSIQ